MFVSKMNYFLGSSSIDAGTLFNTKDWVEAGGRESDLKLHIEKGYVTEAVQVVPEALVTKEEKVVEEVVKEKPTGVWNYSKEDLEPLSLEILNTMYKQRASEFNLSVRAMKDKESLINKMTSES